MTAIGVLVTLLAAAGAARLLAEPAAGWVWVAAGSVISAAGVWAGVPETGPALLAGGGLAGLTVAAGLCRARWTPTAGAGAAAVIGWAALSGAAGRPWATIGGALCTGVAPWVAVCRLVPAFRRTGSTTWSPGPWLLGSHTALVVVAARWIGVVPHAGWLRVAVVAAAGLAVAGAARGRA